MRISIFVILSVIVGGCSVKAPVVVNSIDPTLSQFAFAMGTWSESKDSLTTSEHWIAPGGKILLGVGSTVKSGKTVFFEFLRVESRDDGIYYIAQPKGNPPVEFKMIECTKDHVIFENAQHDYPSRVIYHKIDNDTLKARIEGKQKGQDASNEWLYKRVK